ncbi:MAG: TraR/DksA family transcriptional regulator [Bryobacteraceae bacterium]|jgi:DnaK suppressor protein
MTTRTITKFRRRLEARKAELIWEMQKHRRRLAVGAGADPVDRARSLGEGEFAVRNLDRETALLHKVMGALREIEEGTFGRCAACDREIPRKRLEAVPWSPYCVACQEAAEARQSKQPAREAGDAAGYALAS